MARKVGVSPPSRLEKIVGLLAKAYEEEDPTTEQEDPFILTCWFLLGRRSKPNGRRRAFEALRRAKGFTPDGLLSMKPEKLSQVCAQAGPYEDKRGQELLGFADKVEEQCGSAGLAAKLNKTKKDKRREFLSGKMGLPRDVVDFILLYVFGEKTLPLTARFRRILLRLGYEPDGVKKPTDPLRVKELIYEGLYAKVAAEWKPDAAWLRTTAHLFQRHGEEVCFPAGPACNRCPLLNECTYGLRRTESGEDEEEGNMAEDDD